MTKTENEVLAYVRDKRSSAERRRSKIIGPVAGNQPRTPRELNIAMVAEETAKIAIINAVEALIMGARS
ncbi:MAG: hypothetical protein ACRC8Q_10845 [Aeromonas sp.]